MNKYLYFEHDRKEVLDLVPENYNIVLEIGCGSGSFKKHLSQDCQYWGIEPIKQAASIAAKKLQHVLVGTYEQVQNDLPDNTFDLIICNDVIEHMVDHDAFFQSIKGKMTDNGVLVCSIPNVRYLENLINLVVRKNWQYTESGILDKTHLRFFTEKSLKVNIEENGFIIEKFNYLNSIFTNPYTFGALVKRLLVSILGQDTAYIQFGIRMRKKIIIEQYL